MQIQVNKLEVSSHRVITSACALMFLISLDVTVVNVALPAIQDALTVPIRSLGLTLVAYALPFATLMLSAGALSDRFGPARVCMSGVVILGIGSLIGAAAPHFAVLVLGRVVQGIGAALCMPSSLAVLRSSVPSDRLTQAIALWGFSGSVAISAGPILSGVLVQYTTWQSVFIINIPVVALAAWLLLPAAQSVRQLSTQPKTSVDVIGQALFIASSTLLVGGLTLLRNQVYAVPRQVPVVVLTLSVIGAIAFFLHERRATDPVIPPSLMKHRVFQSAVIVGGSVSFVSFGIVYCLGLYYGIAHEFTPLAVGALYLPSMLATAAATTVVARVRRALGGRMTVTVGIASQLAGSILIGLQPDHVGWVSANAAFLGLGIGLVIPPITADLLTAVDANLSGVASGAFSSIRQFAAAIGIAVLGLLVQGAGSSIQVDLRSIAALCATLLAIVLGTYLALQRDKDVAR
jgi:DHA2 family methylenomycin A resistance protein-like MFS transporter